MTGQEDPFPLGRRSLSDKLNGILLERIYQGAFVVNFIRRPAYGGYKAISLVRATPKPHWHFGKSFAVGLDCPEKLVDGTDLLVIEEHVSAPLMAGTERRDTDEVAAAVPAPSSSGCDATSSRPEPPCVSYRPPILLQQLARP